MDARNAADTSRRAASGRPGERSLARPDMSERLCLVAITTSFGRVLRRPVETAWYLSIQCAGRLADIDPSVGSVGDSHDNALAGSVVGPFTTEVVKRLGPWRTMQDVE